MTDARTMPQEKNSIKSMQTRRQRTVLQLTGTISVTGTLEINVMGCGDNLYPAPDGSDSTGNYYYDDASSEDYPAASVQEQSISSNGTSSNEASSTKGEDTDNAAGNSNSKTVQPPPPARIKYDDTEFYLDIVSANGAVIQKRLYFPVDMLPTAELSTGWAIMIEAMPAVFNSTYDQPCLPYGTVPPAAPWNSNTTDDIILHTRAFLVTYWEPLGPPAWTTDANSASDVWPPVGSYDTWDVSSITYILNVCGQAPSITQASVKKAWFGPSTYPIGPPSLKDYYTSCSYGSFTFTEANNIVVGPINVPCSGFRDTDHNCPWGTDTCSSNNANGWVEYAEQYAAQNLSIDITKYRHSIVLLSSDSPCYFGFATFGCSGRPCRVWMSMVDGATSPDPSAAFHELGHNYFLNHAGDGADPTYGDETCAMGFSGPVRCYNNAHTWQMGWSQPIQNGDVALASLPANKWSGIMVIPSMLTNPNNFVRVNPSDPSLPTYYIGYRTRVGYDSLIPSGVNRKIAIYQFNGTSMTDLKLSELKGYLTPKKVYDDPDLNLRIYAQSTGVNSANIRICRYTDNSVCH